MFSFQLKSSVIYLIDEMNVTKLMYNTDECPVTRSQEDI